MLKINNFKKYKLRTIKDIENVITPKNIECFKKDFCLWLDILVSDRKHTIRIIKSNGEFIWIDDGKTGINSLKFVHSKKEEIEK